MAMHDAVIDIAHADPAPYVHAGADGLNIVRLTARPDRLGESPIWDVDHQCLWWVDGVVGRVRRLRWRDSRPAEVESFALGEHVGAVVLAAGGRLVATLEHSFVLFDPTRQGSIVIAAVRDADPRTRLNDAKTDRQGRLICAGMGRMAEPLGRLHQIDRRGCHRIFGSGLKIGNGICFSPEGRTLYVSDTPARRVFACDYDPDTGRCSSPRLHIDTSRFASGGDGATVDASGDIWIALVGAGLIGRFDPAGRLVDTFEAPVDLPSSLAFGGPDMTTLFVTSIQDSGTGRAVSSHPDGGHLFAVEGLGARGIPETPFAGIA
jgi:sugar lactone lactonase YvrE